MCAFAKHHDIYGYKTRIYMRTKYAYICVQKMHIFAHETRIYLLTSEQLVPCLIGGHYQFDAKGFNQKARRKARRNGELL